MAESHESSSGQPARRPIFPPIAVGGVAPAAPPAPATTAPATPAQAPQDAAEPRAELIPRPAPSYRTIPLPDGLVEQLPPIRHITPERLQLLEDALGSIAAGGQPFGPPVPSTPALPEAAAPARRKGLAEPPRPAPPAPPEAERQWPSGPLVGRDLLRPDEVQRLVETILQDEEIMAHPTMPGLTRARLREAARAAGLEPSRFGKLSAAVVVWFARAGVTVLADDKAPSEWARPRPLVSGDRAEVRRLLRAVDPPDGDAVAIARAAGLDSSEL